MPEPVYQMPQEPEGARGGGGERETRSVVAQHGAEHGRPGMPAVPRANGSHNKPNLTAARRAACNLLCIWLYRSILIHICRLLCD